MCVCIYMYNKCIYSCIYTYIYIYAPLSSQKLAPIVTFHSSYDRTPNFQNFYLVCAVVGCDELPAALLAVRNPTPGVHAACHKFSKVSECPSIFTICNSLYRGLLSIEAVRAAEAAEAVAAVGLPLALVLVARRCPPLHALAVSLACLPLTLVPAAARLGVLALPVAPLQSVVGRPHLRACVYASLCVCVCVFVCVCVCARARVCPPRGQPHEICRHGTSPRTGRRWGRCSCGVRSRTRLQARR
jgi:hypothetical protein